MCWIDPDNSTTQSDGQINDSANRVDSNSDERSDDSLQEDVISLTDRSVDRSSLPPKELETFTEEVPTTETIIISKAQIIEAPEDEPAISPKKSKKSKVKRGTFEC